MNGREMVKDIADFVKANRLEDLELQEFDDLTFSFYFNEEHTDEIEYTFDPVRWTETIKHLKWGGEDDGYIIEEKVLTREEALRLRFPKTKSLPRARGRMFYFKSEWMVNDFIDKYKGYLSTPGKNSYYPESGYRRFGDGKTYRVDMLLTKDNLECILNQIEYEEEHSCNKTCYIVSGINKVIKQNYSDSTIATIDKLNKKDWRDEYVSKGTR